ncbi:MAG TPA: polysaccharide pyruvyl transferase family protein [Candidatus Binatia bacterium]|nr:polysaccharide pyruvyl transferase family protein [Candidatus Binatia bacterium]
MTNAPRVLLVGYNGADNTGAEARVVAAIKDVRAVMGPEAEITVPTLNVEKTRRYIEETANVRLVHIPLVYFLVMRKLVREHDLILLVEGSVYMDSWSSLFLWYFLWATRLARTYHKPCLAYAVDVGSASLANQGHIRREANKTDLIVTRTHAAAETLNRWGLTAPMEVTADLAVGFPVDADDQDVLSREWPAAGGGVVGVAMVDFYRFPVVIRPWGRRADRYSWPAYFAHTPEQHASSQALTVGYVAMIDRLWAEHHRPVALICMEELDEALARRVQGSVRYPEQTRIFSARVHTASEMTSVLHGLDLLITARYHGSVLALAGLRPQIAFGHDLRLKTLYQELGLYPDYFIDAHTDDRFKSLDRIVDRLLWQPAAQVERLRLGYKDQLTRGRRNRELLREFVSDHGWGASRWAA